MITDKKQAGFALLLVLGVITILTALLVEFTFDTQVNKTILSRKENRTQARLNAESGLHLAFARILIYKEALNMMRQNPDLKGLIPEKEISQIYTQPFLYPLPVGKNPNLIVKNIVEEMDKNLLFQGHLSIEAKSLSQKLNINLLRVSKKKNNNPEGPPDPATEAADTNKEQKDDGTAKVDVANFLQEKFVQLLDIKLKEKKETDPDYDYLYGNEPTDLHIKRIKFYISEENSYDEAEKNQISGEYKDSVPKTYPITSLSELYLVPQIPVAIIELLIPLLTTFGGQAIDLNSITSDQIKWLVPDLDERGIKEFFRLKNSKNKPRFFSGKDDFIKLLAQELRLVEESALKKRMEEFEAAGFSFEGLGSLLEVTSVGEYLDSKYQIKALIELPLEPEKNQQGEFRPIDPQTGKCPDNFELSDANETDPNKACKTKKEVNRVGGDDKKNKKKLPLYLTPRIVEISTQ